MTAKTISAIVTAYRFERFIRTAIASIQQQTLQVDQIIVVVSRSEDATSVIVAELATRDPRIVRLDVEARGPAYSRNRGLEAATGDIIAMLDGDDAWPKHKLAAQVARLEGEPRVDMVSGQTEFVDAIDDVTLTPPPGARRETILGMNVSTCVYGKRVFETLGGFDEGFRYADDLDLLLRIRDAEIPFAVLDEVMLYHRRYPGSLLTQRDPKKAQEAVLAVGRSRRRRQALGLPSSATFFAEGATPK